MTRPTSLAPGDVMRRWPLWLQWLTVAGLVGSPTGLVTWQRSDESAELAALRSEVTRLRETVATDHARLDRSRETLARIERDMELVLAALGQTAAPPPPEW